MNGTNVLLQESLACKVATPLDSGESITHLCMAIQRFMPENFMAAMATCSACIMGANYMSILEVFGCCGVPVHLDHVSQRLQNVLWQCMARTKHINVTTKLPHHTYSKQPATQPSQFALTTSVKRQLTPGKS